MCSVFFFDRVLDFIAAHAPPSWYVYNPFLALLAIFILLYADDIALIANSPERLQQLLHAFTHFADMSGMRISQDTMQVLLYQSRSSAAPLTCQGLWLSFTVSYRYLGQDNSVSPWLLTDLALTQVIHFQ